MRTTERLLTVREVAGAMRVSNMTVYRLIKSGELPAIRVGRNLRIRASELDRYLDERAVTVAAGHDLTDLTDLTHLTDHPGER